MTMTLKMSILAFACIAGCGVAAAATNRKVDIVNGTDMTMKHFYASTPDVDNWEENILGSDILEAGETFEADIDDGTGACVFDFKADFANGTSSVRRGVNVCKVGTFTYK